MRNRTACLMLENMLLYNREEIFSKSIRHCHLKGVHSFDLSPEAAHTSMRVFYAELPIRPGDVAYHMHRRSIEIIPVYGNLYNCNAYRADGVHGAPAYNVFEYKSGILTEEGSFTKLEKKVELVCSRELVTSPLHLNGWQYHSVECEMDTIWIVLEWDPTPDYKSEVWTANNTMPGPSLMSQLYKPMDEVTFSDFFNLIQIGAQ